jgi:hypothetical protein
VSLCENYINLCVSYFLGLKLGEQFILITSMYIIAHFGEKSVTFAPDIEQITTAYPLSLIKIKSFYDFKEKHSGITTKKGDC